MAKFDPVKLTLKEKQELIAPLIEALYRLKTREQIREFISRLLTPSELVMLGRRMVVAEKLVRGKSYETIRKETGVGFSTIRNVDGWLEHAVRDYYDVRAEQLRETEEQTRRKNWRRPSRFGRSDMILIDLLVDSIIRTKLKP